MRETELISELARRAQVPEEAARAVLTALSGALRAGEVSEEALRSVGQGPAPAGPADLEALKASSPTDPRVVDDLISCARSHPLGIEFLERGYLGSVAVELHSHAFTVEAARERLHASGPKGPGEEGPR
ncbi:hypothetical protein FBQ97_06200 [Acidobacteria bacterium ACD]|nr:MAG: hypothetical protein EDX89_20740 [Acidobacteriota bacterium]MDL1949393.1 hypothetical protein [Acidobacteria bacterium ACD]